MLPASMIEFSMRLSRERLRSARPLPTSVKSPELRSSAVKTAVRAMRAASVNPSGHKGQDERGCILPRGSPTPHVLTP